MWTDYYAIEDEKVYEVVSSVTPYGNRKYACIGRRFCNEYGVKQHLYETRELAEAAGNKKITKRVASLKKQIERLEKIDLATGNNIGE